MRDVTLALVVTALVLGSGCAQKDWIDRTLVTVDVTGTWEGSAKGLSLKLELEQEGSTVKGFVRYRGVNPLPGGSTGGPIDGTVAGDVFRFNDSRGSVEGELTVSGDEMSGLVSYFGQQRISLRRADPSSPPASPPR
jgi:hypothetical protein